MAMNAEDPFIVLGVSESASDSDIRSAFRRLALRCHPDRHPKDPLAKARFQRLVRAKEVLLDSSKRKLIKSRRCNQEDTSSASQIPRDRVGRCRQNVSQHFSWEQRFNAASATRQKQRQAAAEDLDKKERDQNKKTADAKDTIDAKLRAAAFVARETAKERAATRERRKARIIDVFLRKKKAKIDPEAAKRDAQGHHRLSILVARFIQSLDQVLFIAGPLSTEEQNELHHKATIHGFTVAHAQKRSSFILSKTHHQSEHGFESEPLGGIQQAAKTNCTGKPTSKSTGMDGPDAGKHDQNVGQDDRTKCNIPETTGRDAGIHHAQTHTSRRSSRTTAERHRAAIERLQIRRRNGEGVPVTVVGSWWAQDEEADRWTKYVDRCGF